MVDVCTLNMLSSCNDGVSWSKAAVGFTLGGCIEVEVDFGGRGSETSMWGHGSRGDDMNKVQCGLDCI